MTILDYRAYISVVGLPFSDEETWEPVIEHLEANTDFGPIIGWSGETAEFIMSTDRFENADEAVEAFIAALKRALGEMPSPRQVTIDGIVTEHTHETVTA